MNVPVPLRTVAFTLALALSLFGRGPAAGGPFAWQTVSPETEGFSTEKLDALRDGLAQRGTKALLVIRNDRIVYEWYSPGHGPNKKHYTASMAKALVGGVSLLIALNDGWMAVDDPACKYVAQWAGDPVKSKITIRHLATHSSGILVHRLWQDL